MRPSAAFVFLCLLAAGNAWAQDCDRACLESTLDRRFVLIDPERGLLGPVESVLHQVPSACRRT